MVSELSFLIELLLNHELTKPTKDLIASRIKDVEQSLSPRSTHVYTTPTAGITQAPSTLALMAKHGDIIVPSVPAPEMPAVPVEHIAKTPLAADAMNRRNQLLQDAVAGKVDKGRTSPRKFP